MPFLLLSMRFGLLLATSFLDELVISVKDCIGSDVSNSEMKNLCDFTAYLRQDCCIGMGRFTRWPPFREQQVFGDTCFSRFPQRRSLFGLLQPTAHLFREQVRCNVSKPTRLLEAVGGQNLDRNEFAVDVLVFWAACRGDQVCETGKNTEATTDARHQIVRVGLV